MSYMPVEQLMTADDYLQWQALQEVPHELIAGHLHPLPPRDRVFFRLLVNLTSAIQGQRGERADWETSLSDCPLVVSDHDVLLPDAFVARIGECHSPRVALAIPATTRRIADRRRLDAQRRIATLLELVIVDRETRTVTVERRTGPGTWSVERLATDFDLRLDALGITVAVADVFGGLDRDDPALTLDEFCAWEAKQSRRHEFFHGRIRAMTGALLDHGTVGMNLAAALHQHLRGTPCRVFAADAAVNQTAGTHFYPDVVVTCEPIDIGQQWLLAPILVIEVLSISTQRFDRTEKAQAYFRLPSLREYVLVDHRRRRIDLHRREPDGSWSCHPSIGDAPLHLQSLDLTIPAALIYERIGPSGLAAA
ncbi:Uma2 family endonuclease [Roseateles sp. So40a]|uniref:Uma2 family endonuclease n=1 Tax=Roseateles sp. So40a TaxID=3400226 RepID=UPI003A85DE6C